MINFMQKEVSKHLDYRPGITNSNFIKQSVNDYQNQTGLRKTPSF